MDSDISIEVKNNDYGYDIKVDDEYLISVDKISYMALDLIGRKAFWLDPCALRGEEHTSDWKEIAEVNYEIIIFDDGTEALLDECYM